MWQFLLRGAGTKGLLRRYVAAMTVALGVMAGGVANARVVTGEARAALTRNVNLWVGHADRTVALPSASTYYPAVRYLNGAAFRVDQAGTQTQTQAGVGEVRFRFRQLTALSCSAESGTGLWVWVLGGGSDRGGAEEYGDSGALLQNDSAGAGCEVSRERTRPILEHCFMELCSSMTAAGGTSTQGGSTTMGQINYAGSQANRSDRHSPADASRRPGLLVGGDVEAACGRAVG